MKTSWNHRLQGFMLPGLKRWILIILIGIFFIIYGVFLILGFHPLFVTTTLFRELMLKGAEVLPYHISGVIVILSGVLFVSLAIAKLTSSILGAYLPDDRESIPDVLYQRRRLDRGPRVVVIGGGTGLSTLLKGIKEWTTNITAIVTVGDDGGSSGRLRQELGVLPPGDIRNCITALADEEKLVTELFRYRFESGQGLEGHSFGNLFLTALVSITKGDMLEAVRVASRVLNSRGQVLPATLSSIVLVAEMEDGRQIRGESQIPKANGKILKLTCEPDNPVATPEAVRAILQAELIVLGPGSLYTSVVPNLLVRGIADAIRESRAKKIYVCNVMTQQGETTNYSVADHVETVITHAGIPQRAGYRLMNAVLVNDELYQSVDEQSDIRPVKYDPERLRELGVAPVRRSLVGSSLRGHHDPDKLAQEIIWWYEWRTHKRAVRKQGARSVSPKVEIRSEQGSGHIDARPFSKIVVQPDEPVPPVR